MALAHFSEHGSNHNFILKTRRPSSGYSQNFTENLPHNLSGKMTLKQSAIFLQKACIQHRYIRNQDLSNVVERPERLRAVNIGLAAAVAHLEELLNLSSSGARDEPKATLDPNDLAAALGQLNLTSSAQASSRSDAEPGRFSVPIIQSDARVDILRNQAVKFIHGDIDGDVYLETLSKWVRESLERITRGESEIPEGYSQGDLYCESSSDSYNSALEPDSM